MKYFLTKNKLLIAIIFLAAILRFYQLGNVPPSLNWDEASNAYNAYSILKTARDEYGNFIPLTFRSFGDYNPAMSVYTLIPSLAVFGETQFAVRFPSALLGTLTVLFTYLMVKELFRTGGSRGKAPDRTRSENVALLSAFFLAISPWHLHFSRYDHEANFMLAFGIIGLTLLLFATRSKKALIYLSSSSVFFGLALNSYHGSKIWIPLFLITVFVFFHKEILRLKLKLIIFISIILFFTLPIVVNYPNSLIRGQSVGIFKNPHRMELFITGYLSHFSPNFLFASADSIGRHAVPGMGEEYIFVLPLIIIGLLTVIKSKTGNIKFLLAWLLVAPIPASIATPTPHALRALTFLPLWSTFAAAGLAAIISSNLKRTTKQIFLGALLIVAFYNLVTYFHLYYKHYPKEKAIDWQYGYKETVEYVNAHKNDYEVIAMTNYYGKPYIFFLFYSKYDPKLYQSQSENKDKFDKFEFFGSSWDKKVSGKAMIIRPAWQKPIPAPKYLKEIKDTNDQVVFRISEE
ncbi:MAG: glycosyltransferase family 39 protein [Candidatus Curtissbacteria bacterium]|nr:glycosyltransferase family 39 protein [Candidatus Curtissbacteria bacterium]